MHTLYRYPTLLCLLGAGVFAPLLAKSDELPPNTQEIPIAATNSPLNGQIQATFDQNSLGRSWSAHIIGNFQGDSSVQNMFVYGTDAHGALLDEWTVSIEHPELAASPFTLTVPLPKPDPDWSKIGIGMKLADSHGSTTEIVSAPYPIIWQEPIVMDHAWSGSLVVAPNYMSGGIPDGVGIPHSLINSIPEGSYYAVVFFDQKGCPSSNYAINSFRPNMSWGDDSLGPNGPYSKAFDTKGGGCMQKIRVDPHKDGEWLWGAISNTGTSSQLADTAGIPAFAICASASACDPIVPRVRTVTSSTTATSSPSHTASSVLFLPGIKGSMLYGDNFLCVIPSDSCGISLWPPLAVAAATRH